MLISELKPLQEDYRSECWAMKVNSKTLDSHHGDEDASRDPTSFETESHAKRRNVMHITACTDRRDNAAQ